jgi:hypothetical protein
VSDGPFNPPGSHLDDEQLSLVIDGLGDPETLAHLEQCTECGARAARWRQVRNLVAAPPAAAPGNQRDAAIRAALEVFADRTERTEPAEMIGPAGVRRHRIKEWRPVAGVAAALLVVAGLAFGISQSGPDHSAATASRSSAVSKAAAGGSASESQQSPAALPAAAPPAVALGSFSDMAALRSVLWSRIEALPAGASASGSASASGPASAPTFGSASGISTEPAALRCLAAASHAAALTPAAAPELDATLTYAGTPAVVYVYQAPASHVAVVLSDPSCQVLAKGSF